MQGTLEHEGCTALSTFVACTMGDAHTWMQWNLDKFIHCPLQACCTAAMIAAHMTSTLD